MKVSIAEFDYKEILESQKKRPVIDGVKFRHLLGLLFIGLKLTSVIAWSWWWVLAPFWIPALVYALLHLKVMMRNLSNQNLSKNKNVC